MKLEKASSPPLPLLSNSPEKYTLKHYGFIIDKFDKALLSLKLIKDPVFNLNSEIKIIRLSK
jgi:hypothetical protein